MEKIIWDYQTDCCYVCGTKFNLHTHHIFPGRNRKVSDEWNMTIKLCAYHHNMSNNGIHFDKELDLQVRQMAQREFEKRYGHEKFMKLIGRNYL